MRNAFWKEQFLANCLKTLRYIMDGIVFDGYSFWKNHATPEAGRASGT
jgi:hypothetical protein